MDKVLLKRSLTALDIRITRALCKTEKKLKVLEMATHVQCPDAGFAPWVLILPSVTDKYRPVFSLPTFWYV